ncbi:MAG TPA: N,N-dimethylformamidase beta subunit family domain-containing protein [Solirubrobacter sp.]
MTLVARVTFLVLVAASFSAFFVAQRLKSTPAIIDVGSIARYFSPNGDGSKDVNRVSIRLRVSDDATVDVVNLDGDRIKRLGENVPMKAYRPLRLSWDGTTDAGGRAPDGQYRIRVALRNEGRSATIQKTTLLDTKAPQPVACIGFRCANTKDMGNVISQGDRRVLIYVRGVSRSPTGFTLYRTDQGKPRKIGDLPPLKGGFTRKIWDGLVDNKPLAPGTYLMQVRVRDRAGNVGVSPAEFEVGAIRGRPGITVRGLAAQPPLQPVTEGQRVEFHVDARGAAYRWRVRRVGDSAVRKRGTETAAVLAFRAPTGPSGVYLLELRSGRWHTTVPFLVQAEKRSSVLVVVPAVTWLGTDKVDDRPFDGLPNTLTDGGTVRWPRPFVGDDGLPADFATQIAPLLVFLDRQRIRYDLTSDLDLDLTRNPRASDRPGVLFAGSERWITRSLAKRLRRYVTDGGHVALFGGDTMLRGVRLRVFADEDSGTLSRATQPTSTDPFGARIGKTRTLAAPATLSQFEGGTDYGLMEGANDLPGFKVLQESTLVDGKADLASVGQPLTPEEEAASVSSGKEPREIRPALAATQLGKGVVIRVGLPEWTSKLSDSNVSQVTRNIIDILRGVKPRIRSTK